MYDPATLDALVRARIEASAQERSTSRQAIEAGHPLQAETDPVRRASVEQRPQLVPPQPAPIPPVSPEPVPLPPAAPDQAERLPLGRKPQAAPRTVDRAGAEAIQGDSIDYLDVAFLTIGVRAALAVGQILAAGGRSPLGTCALISPELILTNNHVIGDVEAARDARVAFEYELDERTAPKVPTIFALDPERCFVTVSYETLDFSVIAVGTRLSGPRNLDQLGYLPLSDRKDKSAKGLSVNIVEHPNGWYKKLVLRENRIVARGLDTLHYEADTEGGSSGSPVLNDAWEMVALHHWGAPHLETKTVDGADIPVAVNEGIRVSRIVEELTRLVPTLPAAQQPPLVDALARGAASSALGAASTTPLPSAAEAVQTQRRTLMTEPRPEELTADLQTPAAPTIAGQPPATQTLRFVVPIEVTVRVLPSAPGLTPQMQMQASPLVPASDSAAALTGGPERVSVDPDYSNRRGYDESFLSGLTLELPQPQGEMAGLVAPLLTPGRRAGVLDYEHYSVSLRGDRRIALYTATNIDGAHYIPIDRKTGLPSAAAESGEQWFSDPRIDPRLTTGQDFYSANSSYFDRGHLTRRSDVAWGTVPSAEKANADTFHFTNCSPQHWQFNESSQYWQGVEQYVLEFGALIDHSRLTVFQGPILKASDPSYGAVQVPLAFWKIVVRMVAGTPQASAFLVDQSQLLNRPRRGVRPATLTNAPQVDQFRVPISRIERETGLSFGALHDHDTFPAGPHAQEANEQLLITGWSDLG
ncbi:DNA/RNA non-specific endonuclease [Deinococcus sp.]|uniref:DNA/RNA non-specific endonuclease n=1 Tax=Deinococcus sp. TaxID=47478 RepID=UPI003CC6D612